MTARLINRTRAIRASRTAALAALMALVLFALAVFMSAARAQAPGYSAVAAGAAHTCAIQVGGSVVCWGENDRGESTPLGGVFKQVAAGSYHTCGLRNNGAVECWGSNEYMTGEYDPQIGAVWAYSGQANPPQGVYFAQIDAGEYHTCGITLAGDLNCWGYNGDGEAPDVPGPFKQVSAGRAHTCALTGSGDVKCWGGNAYGQVADLMGPFIQVDAGWNHTCAVRGDGSVNCWGGNTWGQSTPPAGTFAQVAAGGLHTCGLTTQATLACWGYNFYGQVKRAPEGKFTQVASGEGHSCAILDLNEVYCWGKNDHRQATVPAVGGPGGGATYQFGGFYPPVEADPVLNVVKAGSAVPLKFNLGGDKGLQILAAGSPASVPLDCANLDPGDDYQPAKSAGGSGLGYDAASGQYSYIWKTEKAWAGTCRVLSLRLADETEHRVAFQFR
jgi:Regulator of chromosome condensation (RCC1) repeat